MHPLARACPASRQHLATREHLADAGISRYGLEALLRSGGLLRIRRGVYAPAPLPVRARHLLSGGLPDPAYVAEVRAVLLSLGADCAAAGRTAAVLWGMDMFVEPRLVEVNVPTGRSRVALPGVDATRRADGGVVELGVLGCEGLPVTTALVTVVECALTRPLREAVVIADSALRRGLITLDELVAAVGARSRRPGARRLRRVLEFVDPACESVLESLFRVLALEHGLHPESQVTVRRPGGGRVGRFDFCFRQQRLIVECDGRRWHDPEDVREKDRRKDNELARLRWRLLRITWDDVVHHPDYVGRLLKDCLAPQDTAA